MSKPSKVEALFMPTFLEMDLLTEFARQIRFKETPHLFVNFYMELLRSPTLDAERQAATTFLVFVRGRSWPEVLELFSRHAGPEEMKALQEPHAEKFFTEFALMAQQQVQDYWEQFMEQRKNAPKQELNPDDFPEPLPPPGERRQALVNDVVGEVVREIKKLMDEGEDWKKT
jgi:hypothetical protein